MDIRILMIGNDPDYLRTDGQMLRANGFRVYICDREDTVNRMVGEVRPDVVYINSKEQDRQVTDIYHNLLDNILYASMPVIYTLLAGDVYLVNRSRTIIKERRYITSGNIMDAIRMSVTPAEAPARKRVRFENPLYSNISTVYRA